MAINRWLGAATAVAQVDTFTPANIEATDIFTLTVTGFDGTSDSISYEAVDTSATTVSGALITLWNNQTGSLFTGITASGTSTVILTADTAGVAFKVASTTTDGTGTDTQTFTRAATTANGGPNDWQDVGNWSAGTVPGAVASEDTIVENSSVDILYGLDNSGASETLTSLNIKQSYTGKIGHNDATEEVGDYLQVKVTSLYIGENFEGTSAAGSGRIKIDTGTVQSEIVVYNTGTSVDTNKPAVRLLATHGSTIIREIRKGTVGLAYLLGETSEISSALLSYTTNKTSDASLTIGAGTTLATYSQIGGKGVVKCAATTATCEGGTLIWTGGAITTLNVDGGSVTPVTTGTITTCNVITGTCDFTASAVPRTVTTLKLAAGATLKLDTSVITLTNKIDAYEAGRVQYRASSV